MVAAHDGGEACVCDLTEPLGLTQPTVSHHLKILVEPDLHPRQARRVGLLFTRSVNPERALGGAEHDPLAPKITCLRRVTRDLQVADEKSQFSPGSAGARIGCR